MIARPRLLLVLLLLPALSLIPASAAGEPDMRIRITTDAVAATLTCDGGLRVLDRDTGKPLGPDPFGTKATFVAEQEGESQAFFRAQVVSLTDETAARELADSLAGSLGVSTVVRYFPDRRAWRVRVGAGQTAEDLDPLVEKLRGLGYDDVLVTLDAPEDVRGGLRVIDAGWNDYESEVPALRVVPVRRGDRIAVGDGTYRGAFEVLLDRRGQLTVVNVLPMELYLRGVVPNELGPAAFPELEALKAQTIAARTYAWRNLGQFTEDGYDLCDTPRCQVYRGAGTEHPLSDRAIHETAGVVATHDGEPIHALYSSTCGGHTEDGNKIFLEEKGAYLKGVPCYPEQQGAPRRTWQLRGRAPGEALVDARGRPIGPDLYLLSSLEVLPDPGWTVAEAGGVASAGEIGAWLRATLQVVGKAGESPGEINTRDDLAGELIRLLDWGDRADLRSAEADLDYLLDFPDAGEVPVGHRRAWSVLLKDGLLRPFPDGTLRPAAAPARAGMVGLLADLVRHYDSEGLRRGGLRAAVGGTLRIETKGGDQVLRLAPDVRLVKELRNVRYPVALLDALTGDKVAFRARRDPAGGEVVDYLEVSVSPRSASDDRFTSVYEWEERVDRDDMAERLAGTVRGIGDLVDLEPVERGISGRVTVLRVRGTSGSQLLRGFPIRVALGLRDTWFTIDRQRDGRGRVIAFRFTGKGWGHGVGMCQVGAFGMAMRGMDYRQILHHYYRDVLLERMY